MIQNGSHVCIKKSCRGTGFTRFFKRIVETAKQTKVIATRKGAPYISCKGNAYESNENGKVGVAMTEKDDNDYYVADDANDETDDGDNIDADDDGYV